MNAQKANCNHDWETPDSWGVVIGVSRCKLCDVVAKTEDFDALPVEAGDA